MPISEVTNAIKTLCQPKPDLFVEEMEAGNIVIPEHMIQF